MPAQDRSLTRAPANRGRIAANLFITFAARSGANKDLLFASFALFADGILVAAFGHSVGLFFLASAMMGSANRLCRRTSPPSSEPF